MDYANKNLRDYYDTKYQQPKSDNEAILTIIKVYQTEMNDYSEKIGEGIHEVYRELLGKGLPSYYWLLEAIHRTSKKIEAKRSFGYIVGTLRNWSLYGFGNTVSDEEEEIFDFFKEVTGVELTGNSRKMISSLMGNFGAFKVMRSISGLKDNDVSVIFAEILGKAMMEKYNEYIVPIEQPKKVLLNEEKPKPKQERSSKAKSTIKSTGTQKAMIPYVVEFLKNNGVSRPTDIANHLNEKGFSNVTQRNITSHLSTVMKNANVVKVGIGQYSYAEVPNE